jgi:hypothetical protein
MTTTSGSSPPCLGEEAAEPNGSSGSPADDVWLKVSFMRSCPTDLSILQTVGERFLIRFLLNNK